MDCTSTRTEGKRTVRFVGAFAGVGSGGRWTRVCVTRTDFLQNIDYTRFDTIKTRLQCSPPGTHHGAIDALVKIVRDEGFLALYKGATPPALGWGAIDSVLFGSLHNFRLLFIKYGWTEGVPGTDLERLTLGAHGMAGLFAGLTSAALATPMELLKVKLQLQLQKSPSDRQFKGPIDCTRQIIRSQGLQGMWTGVMGSLAFRSNFFWMFLSFEALMRGFSLLQGTRYEVNTGSANFLSGGLASFIFWTMAIPADNIKNRMMAYPFPLPYPSASSSNNNMGHLPPSFASMARRIYAREGPGGFYRGLGPSLLRAFPMNACAFFVYEGIMRGLGAEQTRH